MDFPDDTIHPLENGTHGTLEPEDRGVTLPHNRKRAFARLLDSLNDKLKEASDSHCGSLVTKLYS